MIEALEMKAACNGVLRSVFPDMKIYGPDTTGALKRPSFYTEIVPYILESETTNLAKQSVGFKISFMEEVTDEEFELAALAKIRRAFGLKLAVGDRKITVSGVESEYTGSKNDVFQITIKFEWIDTIAVEDDTDLMQQLTYKTVVNFNT